MNNMITGLTEILEMKGSLPGLHSQPPRGERLDSGRLVRCLLLAPQLQRAAPNLPDLQLHTWAGQGWGAAHRPAPVQ